MPPDLAALLRRYKPERRRETLRPEPPVPAAPALATLPRGRPPALLLDTTAIIDDLTGRLPAETAEMLDRSIQFHCSVCLGELTVGLAKRDPAAAETALFRDKVLGLVQRIPDHRLLTPDADTWAAAGTLAGTLARTQRYQREQGRKLLNDALVFLGRGPPRHPGLDREPKRSRPASPGCVPRGVRPLHGPIGGQDGGSAADALGSAKRRPRARWATAPAGRPQAMGRAARCAHRGKMPEGRPTPPTDAPDAGAAFAATTARNALSMMVRVVAGMDAGVVAASLREMRRDPEHVINATNETGTPRWARHEAGGPLYPEHVEICPGSAATGIRDTGTALSPDERPRSKARAIWPCWSGIGSAPKRSRRPGTPRFGALAEFADDGARVAVRFGPLGGAAERAPPEHGRSAEPTRATHRWCLRFAVAGRGVALDRPAHSTHRSQLA